VIIEIPENEPVCLRVAKGDEGIIEFAKQRYGFYYHFWTADEAANVFDPERFGQVCKISADLKAILDEHGEAIQVRRLGHTQFSSVEDATELTELEAAKKAISCGLLSCCFLPYDEAKEWAEAYTGHQAIEARKAIRKILEP
jgi:hypothetical protein